MPTTVRLNEKGLVPAIAQDARTGQVLMLAYMDAEALRRTLETGQAWFYSRSRSELWHKGATSGHFLNVVEVRPDCDGDAILLRVEPTGPACHTGNDSCFYQEFDRAAWQAEGKAALSSVLEELAEVVAQRRREMPAGSYTADLFRAGTERIAQKVIEEAGETALAAVAGAPERVRAEAADLLYHTLVLLEAAGVTLDDVAGELEKRRR
ncbi:MAG: bifunctional phosphoribosyl-AMP cyclohydrolase/phosphoribosyl-ATP diphosphatase HisIE [Chloroflexi bacterium]|nr:bifunctional phosphoribosyl-AMP cyclohydrolase/phosphoribosyl-ATP diphosphatase HisIE [Chloroflexota bacterium]